MTTTPRRSAGARLLAMWQGAKDRNRARRTERAIRDLPERLRADLGLSTRRKDWPAPPKWTL